MSISPCESAPTTNGGAESPEEESPSSTPSGHPRWINPCGFDVDTVDLSAPSCPNIAGLLAPALGVACTAYDLAYHNKEEFIETYFGHTNFEQHHKSYKERRLDWLPKLPKELDMATPKDHLETLYLETALVDAYEMLQHYAVALEQVVYDMRGGTLYGKFRSIQNNLRALLMEVQTAMADCRIRPKPDVERDIMGEDVRKMSDNTANRRVRDWLIYRDYLVALQYLLDVFNYLKDM